MAILKVPTGKEIASGLFGLSGAEIAFVAREGAYNCLRRTLDIGELIRQDEADLDLTTLQVCQDDFESALLHVGNRGHPDSLGRERDVPCLMWFNRLRSHRIWHRCR